MEGREGAGTVCTCHSVCLSMPGADGQASRRWPLRTLTAAGHDGMCLEQRSEGNRCRFQTRAANAAAWRHSLHFTVVSRPRERESSDGDFENPLPGTEKTSHHSCCLRDLD